MNCFIQHLFNIIQQYIVRYDFIEWIKTKKMIIRSFWLRGLFTSCHTSVHFGKIGKIHGAKNISIDKGTFFHDFFYLTSWPEKKATQTFPILVIGKNCDFGAYCHISCANKILIGNNCLTGKWVTITDNNHGDSSIDSLAIPPKERAISSKGPIIIEDNVWIGDKATILPGVTIGKNSVIAANAVITKDVPANSIAVGCPAKIIFKRD